MANSVSDFRVRIFTVLDDSIDDRFNFFATVQIFSHLRKGHDGSILVSPVIVVQRLLDNVRKDRQ